MKCLGQYPWGPGPCPQGKLSCCLGRVHTYTPASGFRGFPYLWQTTSSPSNKDHLSCLSQTTEPTRKQKGVGSTLEVGACQWPGPGSGRKPGPGPEKGLPGEEAKPAGHHQPSLAGSSSRTGFGSGKLARRKTPGPSLLRGRTLEEWHPAGAEATLSAGESQGVPREMGGTQYSKPHWNKRQADSGLGRGRGA